MSKGIQAVAKRVILDELRENTHPEAVEDVIFWALEHYAKPSEGTWGESIAYCIVNRIKEEAEYQERNN